MGTPHIGANKGDFAKVVLMPGDPLRAKWIAENYLVEPKLVTNLRDVSLHFLPPFVSWPARCAIHTLPTARPRPLRQTRGTIEPSRRSTARSNGVT